jgi:phytoene dehydrogenase-like protein
VENYDTLVLGSGMAGLTIAALLAETGERVGVLEAHEHPGGNAHSFAMGPYRFCAQVHYIFGCAPGEPVHEFLRRVGLLDEIEFVRLDPDGYDHVVIAGERTRIPSGFERYRDQLLARFPAHERPLRAYFKTITAIRDELDLIPDHVSLLAALSAPFRVPHLLRYRNWTLGQYFDSISLPQPLRAILAGQAGDYLLPPSQVSFILHVGLVSGYDAGAYYPRKHFAHMIDRVVARIESHPGCRVLLEQEVTDITVGGGRVDRVRVANGSEFRANRYVSNIDPQRTLALIGPEHVPSSYRERLDYRYSCGAFSIYLGVQGLDLREHAFGSFNVWHYPHDDIDRIYRDQVERRDFADPWLFVSTPSLHSDAPGLCPPGHDVIMLATSCNYAHFADLLAQGRSPYVTEKNEVRERLLDVFEQEYLPGLRDHLRVRVAGTPTTNERFVGAPFGNAYGAELTPENVRLSRVPFETPLGNLWLVNATAGYPSISGTVRSALRLYDDLSRQGVGS